MIMMYSTSFPTASPRWKHVKQEIVELWEEVKTFNWTGIRDEACDVYTIAMIAITTYTGIPMPLFWLRSAKVWVARLEWWKEYLGNFNLEFKPEYLTGGGNYKKLEKRHAVLRLAIMDQQGGEAYERFMKDHKYTEV
jgi:hypothetical protein